MADSVARLALALAVFALTPACGGGPTGPIFSDPSFVQVGPAQPPTDPSEMRVLTPSNRSEWPRGLTVSDGEIVLEEGWPTPETPHLRLGSAHVRYRQSSPPLGESREDAARREGSIRAQALLILRQEAAKVGANAIYVTRASIDERTGAFRAVALRLSDARPVYPSAEEVLAELPKPEGYRLGERSTTTLEEGARFTVQGAPSKCFILLVALDANADLEHKPNLASGLLVDVETTDPALEHTDILGRVFREARGGVIDIDCAVSEAPITVSLQRGRGNHGPLGRGTVVVHVYERMLSAAEKAARRKNGEARRRSACQRCSYALDRCADPNLCAPYRKCLGPHALGPRDCAAFR